MSDTTPAAPTPTMPYRTPSDEMESLKGRTWSCHLLLSEFVRLSAIQPILSDAPFFTADVRLSTTDMYTILSAFGTLPGATPQTREKMMDAYFALIHDLASPAPF